MKKFLLLICLLLAVPAPVRAQGIDATSSILVVDTYNDLAGLTKRANMLVQTRGYTTASDGNGALYRYDAGTDTFMTVAQSAQDMVNVKQFGATGDGSTDDSAAVTAAIAAASTDGTLYFPEGRYVLSNVQVTKGLTITGPGVILHEQVASLIVNFSNWDTSSTAVTLAEEYLTGSNDIQTTQVTWTDHGLSRGDVIKFADSTNDGRGEIGQVLEVVDDDNVKLDRLLEFFSSADVGTVVAFKMPNDRLVVDICMSSTGDFSTPRPTPLRYALTVAGAVNPDIRVRMDDAVISGVLLADCLGGRVVYTQRANDDQISDSNTEQIYGYGVVATAGTCGTEVTLDVNGGRHGFTTSSNAVSVDTILGTTNRHDGVPHDVTVSGIVRGSHSAAFDTHQYARRIHFHGCRALWPNTLWATSGNLPEGFQDRAYDTTFIDCSVSGARFAFLLDPAVAAHDTTVSMRGIEISDCTFGIDFRTSGTTSSISIDGIHCHNMASQAVQFRDNSTANLVNAAFTGTQSTNTGIVRLLTGCSAIIRNVSVMASNSGHSVVQVPTSYTGVSLDLDDVRVNSTTSGVVYLGEDTNLRVGSNVTAATSMNFLHSSGAGDATWEGPNMVGGSPSTPLSWRKRDAGLITTGSGSTNGFNVTLPVPNNVRIGYIVEVHASNKSGSNTYNPYLRLLVSTAQVSAAKSYTTRVLESKGPDFNQLRWGVGTITESGDNIIVPISLLAGSATNVYAECVVISQSVGRGASGTDVGELPELWSHVAVARASIDPATINAKLTTDAFSGYGSPEGVVTAPIGSTYTDLVASDGPTFYTKETGTGNTGWLANAAIQVFNVKQYGATADGTTNDTTNLQTCITAATGAVAYFPPGVYGVTTALTIPTGTTLWFADGASLKKLSGTGNVITITAANTRVVNVTINLNSVGTRGIVYGSGSDGSQLLGVTTVTGAATGGASTDGAVIVGSTSDIEIDDLLVVDVDDSGNTYRALDLTSSTDIRVNSVNIDNGDIGVNLFAVTNVSIGQVVAKNLDANCIYINDASSHITIGSIEAETVASGITLDSDETEAEVVIGTALISNATYGVDYRSNGGYMISNLYLVEAPFYTTTASARSGLTVGSCRLYYTTNTVRALNLDTADHVTLQAVDISADAPLSGIAAQFTDCNYLTIGSLVVNGVGASPVTEGVRFTASSVTNPVITVGALFGHRVTTAYTVNAAITDPSSVRINGADNHYGSETWQKLTSVAHTLKNLDTAVVSGDDLGEIIIYGSDATGPGNKFRLLTEATDNTGTSRTFIYNDAGALVGVIPGNATNAGMSILLPTSSTGLSSGMIYNNSGTITIVP